jgi:outer membrane receptor for ferrienterochelin and colicins
MFYVKKRRKLSLKPQNVLILGTSIYALGLAAPALAHQDTPVESEAREVVVTGQRAFRAGALDETAIVKTEIFTQKSVDSVHAVNINDVLDKRPGISVQTECSICNVRNVTLNNLPGRFTTLMIDGIPLFSSLSSAYGLDSVSVRGIERIEVSRGAGASLITPEAISGAVNIVTKRPNELEFEALADVGSFGWTNIQLYGGNSFQNGAFSLSASHQTHESVDSVGTGISQYTGYNRTVIGGALFLDNVLGFKTKLRADIISEDRGGGALGDDYASIKASLSGNPFDWSKGPNGSSSPKGWDAPDGSGLIPYTDGKGGFSEIIFTDRTQILGSGLKDLGGGVLRVAGGYAKNDQDSFYEGATYIAEGRQAYAEISYRHALAQTLFIVGANYRYEDLASKGQNASGGNNDGIDDYEYKVPGLFAQAYGTGFEKRLEVNASLRLDDHNVFGSILTPRLNLLWHHKDYISSRLSLGKGYRAPTSFFEQDHGILDTDYVRREINKPEKSDNISYAINYSKTRLQATISANWTKITNFATLDPNQIDTNGRPFTLFTSAADPVTVKGIDAIVSYRFTPKLLVSAAAEKYAFDFTEGVLAFARPDSRIYLTADFDPIKHLHIFTRITWTGEQDLEKFYGTGRFNLNGTPKLTKAPSFTTIDARLEYFIKPDTISLYLGVDNLTDYTQTEKESFLWQDAEGGIDVTHIWGPNRGRFVYAGLKLSY